MRKKEEVVIKEDIQEMTAPEILKKNFMPYAMSVIVSRAIPEIDGLKPSHRKLLYTMYDMGLLTGIRTKSANIAARTMLLNPHGDCLHGDTLFYNGKEKWTIEELCDMGVESFETMSYNIETNQMEKATLSNFRIGQYTDTIYHIFLSNGTLVSTTGNHPILMEDPDLRVYYKKAEDIRAGDRVLARRFDQRNAECDHGIIDSDADIVVSKVEIEHASYPIPMYDFTSSLNENSMIPLGDICICVHNSSNYEAMVRFSQNNETLLTPLVDGKGNFGKHYSRDVAYASSRYTEAKLMPVAHEFFDSIKKNTVDFIDNYDSTRKEPTLLPVTFPNILANPTEGIAVGMASSIPSFNLNELCDATIMRIQHPKTDIRTVMPAPDFTTGAYILMEDAVMDKIYSTGRGSIRMRAKYRVDKKNRIIEVYEIPFSTTAEVVIEGIIAQIKSGKIKEISDVRNEIDVKGFKIAIDYKRGVEPDDLMKKLFKSTKLEDTYSCNMTVLIDGHPREIGVARILDEWIKWRKDCVRRELSFDLAKQEHDLHILEGLAKVLLDIDKAIRIIRKTEDDTLVVANLMKGFRIDEEQAGYIAEIKLRNLNQDYILKKTASIDELKKSIEQLRKQIGSEKEIEKIIIATLKNVKKKYGIERKTEIIPYVAETVEVEKIDNYPVTVYCTKEGYIKKIPEKAMNDSENKLKENDEIKYTIQTENEKELLFFTNKCNVHKLYAHTLKDGKLSDLGDFLINLLDLEEDETVLFVCSGEAGNLLIGFENGKVAKIPLSAYETKLNRRKLLKAYSDLSKPLGFFVDNEGDYALESSNGKVLIFGSDSVPLKTTKSTQGVQILRLAKNCTAVSFKEASAWPKLKKRKCTMPNSGVDSK